MSDLAKEINDLVRDKLQEQEAIFIRKISELHEQLHVLRNNKNKFTIVCNSCGESNVDLKHDIGNDVSYLEFTNCGASMFV